ncbi:hypothetical protein DMZ48_14410 [Robertkochia solimangrovi]|nr:hypothetical protein DMZ48_14410 [Robertkochia solimangrovi]
MTILPSAFGEVGVSISFLIQASLKKNSSSVVAIIVLTHDDARVTCGGSDLRRLSFFGNFAGLVFFGGSRARLYGDLKAQSFEWESFEPLIIFNKNLKAFIMRSKNNTYSSLKKKEVRALLYYQVYNKKSSI